MVNPDEWGVAPAAPEWTDDLTSVMVQAEIDTWDANYGDEG